MDQPTLYEVVDVVDADFNQNEGDQHEQHPHVELPGGDQLAKTTVQHNIREQIENIVNEEEHHHRYHRPEEADERVRRGVCQHFDVRQCDHTDITEVSLHPETPSLLVIGEEGDEEYAGTAQRGVEAPGDELGGHGVLALSPSLVVLRLLDQLLLLVLEVEEGEPHDGDTREYEVVQLVYPLLVRALGAERTDEPEPELHHHEQDVLVEHEAQQVRVTSVALTSMHEQQVA